jgi:hypothetical protein
MKGIFFLLITLSLFSCINIIRNDEPEIYPTTHPDTCNGEYFKKIIDIYPFYYYWQPNDDGGLMVLSYKYLYQLNNRLEIISKKELNMMVLGGTQNLDKNIWVLDGENKMHLMDSEGNILMTRDVYQGSRIIQSTSDNGTIISYSGWYKQNGAVYSTGYYHLDKYNSQGLIEWRDSTVLIGEIQCTIQTKNNEYLVGGYQSKDTHSQDAYLALHSESGKLIWKKIYSDSKEDSQYQIISLLPSEEDANYIAVFQNFLFKIFPSKIDGQGEILWQFNLGEFMLDFNNLIYDHGRYLISYYQKIGKKRNDIFLTCFNSQGSIQWSKQYGGTGDELYGYVVSLLNNDLVFLAQTRNFDSYYIEGYTNAYVMKADSMGEIDCN